MLGSSCLAREASAPVHCSVGKVAVALVGAVCAAFALAADALLIELTGLAAVMHPNLRGVEI